MPRSPHDFEPVVGFPMAGVKNDIVPETEPEIVPMRKIDWKAVLPQLRQSKLWNRTFGLFDALTAITCMLVFYVGGSAGWLLASMVFAGMLGGRAIRCWMNRNVYPLEYTGRKLSEVRDFLNNVGIQPLPPGKYQIIILMDIPSPTGYIIWNAAARRLP